jgi:hypothetical protein
MASACCSASTLIFARRSSEFEPQLGSVLVFFNVCNHVRPNRWPCEAFVLRGGVEERAEERDNGQTHWAQSLTSFVPETQIVFVVLSCREVLLGL